MSTMKLSIKPEELTYDKTKLISKGKMGYFFAGVYRGESVLVKFMSIFLEETHISDFEDDVMFLTSLDHPSVAKCYGYVSGDDSKIVYALSSVGSLRSWIDTNELTLSFIFRTVRDLASAMDYIHKRKTVSIDLDSSMIYVMLEKICSYAYSSTKN
jgi:serine/threonine protein kinase